MYNQNIISHIEMTINEKIKQIEDELSKTQINKATEHHIGILRAKIAKLKREQETNKTSISTHGFDIKRSGDATVVLIGFPSVGKSTLLNKLTSAKSTVGSFQFTTMTVVPGIMKYECAKIQILDLPGIIKGASTGKGLGKRIVSVARNADLILLVLDVFQPFHRQILKNELENIGIRLDQKPPNIILEKANNGGLLINKLIPMHKMSIKLLKEVLHINKINNARIMIKEDIDVKQLIDHINGNVLYRKSLLIINKTDLVDKKFLNDLELKTGTNAIRISADRGQNIDLLKQKIYEKLDLIRIYMKPKGKKADYNEPIIMKKDCTVLDVCNKLHKHLKQNFRYGIIYGKSVKFNGQKTGLTHIMKDGDVLTIIKTRANDIKLKI